MQDGHQLDECTVQRYYFKTKHFNENLQNVINVIENWQDDSIYDSESVRYSINVIRVYRGVA